MVVREFSPSSYYFLLLPRLLPSPVLKFGVPLITYFLGAFTIIGDTLQVNGTLSAKGAPYAAGGSVSTFRK